ncbi:hypothetical protein ACJZ2D_004726 [Fusarium nematophilum]
MAETAGLVLAVIGTADLCLKYGAELQALCSAFRGAETELNERALKLDVGWRRCIDQTELLKEISDLLDEYQRDIHDRTLRMVARKLEDAKVALGKVVEPKAVEDSSGEKSIVFVHRPVKYALKKKTLDEVIAALDYWVQTLGPPWFLLFRMQREILDKFVAKTESQLTQSTPAVSRIQADLKGLTIQKPPHLLLRATDLEKMDISDIPFSSSKIAKNTKSNSSKSGYILDSIEATDYALQEVTRENVRDLAERLQHDDPQTFGLLSCKGFAVGFGGAPSSFTMVFRTPPGLTNPRSLRDHLLSNVKPGSLSQRFAIAQELAKSISYVHTLRFVHKNVRPENILRFDSPGDGTASPVFLLGFGDFRQERDETRRRGDDAVERNLYRHPSRQGMILENKFLMQHDIYSLGVCLLEIGLWQSFVGYGPQGETPTLSSILGLSDDASKDEVAHFVLTKAKEQFVKLAKTDLREGMGTKYAEIVETCLTCLDPDNEDFGDQQEFLDEYGIRVGVRFSIG